MHNDPMHRTDTLNPNKDFIGGKQKRHWIEFQLLDEQGEPLANLPYRAVNEATRERVVPEFLGHSDAEGVIRIEGLHPLPITLLMEANPLADQLQTRRLRAERAEPPRPVIGDRTPLYGPQRSGFSPIEKQALAAGRCYHYLRIGQLCDRQPTFQPPLNDSNQLPAFHFPERKFNGFTVSGDELDRRHVLEVCPFRAWSLMLHHQPGYSLVNAYNQGLMSILAYSTRDERELGSVNEFFEQQCLDLSRTPRVWDNGQAWPCVVVDVPFSDRYLTIKALDTAKADVPEGHTQLFYAISASQVLVAWRGTEMEGLADLITDATFRPVKPEIAAVCEPKVPCPGLTAVGSVHLGFRDAFEVARRVFDTDFGKTILGGARDKKLFICGHSLGGALGLIHAASLKNHNPLLYTYGMPRTFTLHAVQFWATYGTFAMSMTWTPFLACPLRPRWTITYMTPTALLACSLGLVGRYVKPSPAQYSNMKTRSAITVRSPCFSVPSNTSNRRSHHTPLTANPMARPIAALSPTNCRKKPSCIWSPA